MSPMSPKTKKILNIVVDVVVAIVLAFALLLAICTISSKAKGYEQYTEIFGKAYLAVSSDSMEKDINTGEVKEDNFSKGDLITIRVVDIQEARKFKVGDIITYETKEIVENATRLNTHRIVEIVGREGEATGYVTKGDANPGNDKPILVSDVVGIYEGKAGGIGHVFLFMNSSTGFFVCVVLPTLLIVVYFAINLILVIRKEKKAQTAQAEQEQLDEREKIRQELLAEMQANGQTVQAEPQPAASDGEVEQPQSDKQEEVEQPQSEESDKTEESHSGEVAEQSVDSSSDKENE